MGDTYDETRELAEFAWFVADDDRDPVVLIAGCGSATTVERLRANDVATYGFDASADAVDAVPEATRQWVIQADLRDQDVIETLREAFGVDEIDVLLTECMLSFLGPDEATEALGRIRKHPDIGVLLHKIRTDPPVEAQTGEIDATIMSPREWQAVCDPDEEDVWRDAVGRWELPPCGDGDSEL
ncbi:class I SAM-dependent methyltransferase [Halobacteria archaeon AArc-dxtr1]|nr:class I SAM-dependent methyltransferase [Halobacteria archaeon AArc-dxtr1]